MSPAERSSSCEPTSQLVTSSRCLRLSESWRSGVSTQGRAPGAIPTSNASVTDAGSSRPTLSSTPPSLMRCSHGRVHHSASADIRQRGSQRTNGSSVWSSLWFSRRPPRGTPSMCREWRCLLASRRPTTSRWPSSTPSSCSRRQPSRAASWSASAFELTMAVHGRHSPRTVRPAGWAAHGLASCTSTRSSTGWASHKPTDSSSSEQWKVEPPAALRGPVSMRKWV